MPPGCPATGRVSSGYQLCYGRPMATVMLPLLVGVFGALLYGFASNAKLAEIGRILFFVGAFWTVHLLGGKLLHF